MGTSCFVKGPGIFVAALHAIEDEKRDGDRRASGRVAAAIVQTASAKNCVAKGSRGQW